MAITIKDIARIAGVSHTTVSRALRDYPTIAPDTASRIKKIARELGYVPNTVARGLKTNRSHVLGVIVHRIFDPFFGEVLHGIEEILQAEGYSLFLTASQRDPEREKTIVQAMGERRVEGVIICSSHVSEQHRRQLESFNLPVVLLNNQATETSAHSVYHDDAAGSHALTRHLISLGHRRLAYLGNSRAGRTTEERLKGFRQAMAEANLPVPPETVIQAPNGMPEGGVIGAQTFLELPERPTALVCFNDMMAIGAYRVLQGAGLRLPEDCSVTGFDNIELAAYVNPPLTTFNQPKSELGRQAARLVLNLATEEREKTADGEPNVLILCGELCLRDSTAPPVN